MFFKDSAKKKALLAAKSAYVEAATLKGDTREEVAFRRRIGFRSRTHLDKIFIAVSYTHLTLPTKRIV